MRLLISIAVITTLAFCYSFGMAQSKPAVVIISGKITSFEESLPLEGAGILVKGTSTATGTQADGTFNLAITPGDTLMVSLAGYLPVEIKTSLKSKQYDIVLRRNDKNIFSGSNNLNVCEDLVAGKPPGQNPSQLSPVILSSANR
jgi:hypothetical protein